VNEPASRETKKIMYYERILIMKILMNSLSIKEREFVSTEFLNSHGNPCKLNRLSIVYKLNLFI